MTLETKTYTITRGDLIAYAEASGDHNPIHQDEEVARAVGLPGVIAHGMYTLALAARAADTWAGAPGRVVELGAKFTKPVVVPGDVLTATLTVASLRQIGGNDIIGTTSEVTDAGGTLVCATSATLVHRGADA